MKCWRGNFNGAYEGLVAANSQRAAVEIIGTSLYDFRQYWHLQTSLPTWPDFKPFVLYLRRFDSKEPWQPKEGKG